MPRVRLHTPVATKEGQFHAGAVVDVDAATAKAWVDNGNARWVREEKPETTSRPTGRRR